MLAVNVIPAVPLSAFGARVPAGMILTLHRCQGMFMWSISYPPLQMPHVSGQCSAQYSTPPPSSWQRACSHSPVVLSRQGRSATEMMCTQISVFSDIRVCRRQNLKKNGAIWCILEHLVTLFI